MIIEFIKTIILGIVQGVSEWLPISSTGHLILVDEFIELSIYQDYIVNDQFVVLFMVLIQLGSIFAVIRLFYYDLTIINKSVDNRRDTYRLWVMIIIGSVPAGIIGLLFDDYITSLLYNPICVSISLIVYGILFIIIENSDKKFSINSISNMRYLDVLYIGLFQVLALLPGTSRSGSTIMGGMLIGANRSVSASFSFYLAIPVMFGASLLKIIKLNISLDLYGIIILLVGMLVSYLVSLLVIKKLMVYIRKYSFKIFGYYRIVLGIIILLYFGVLSYV